MFRYERTTAQAEKPRNARQIGGLARGYPGPFASFGRMAVFVTARRSVGQAVYSYIAVPRANIRFYRRECVFEVLLAEAVHAGLACSVHGDLVPRAFSYSGRYG